MLREIHSCIFDLIFIPPNYFTIYYYASCNGPYHTSYLLFKLVVLLVAIPSVLIACGIYMGVSDNTRLASVIMMVKAFIYNNQSYIIRNLHNIHFEIC